MLQSDVTGTAPEINGLIGTMGGINMIEHNVIGSGKLYRIMLISRPLAVRIRRSDSDVSDDDVIDVLVVGGVHVTHQSDTSPRGCLAGNS